MKEIPLTQGRVALVDDSDFAVLSVSKWRARKQTKRNIWYAFRSVNRGRKRITILMHKAILPGVLRIDHRDGDGLNNQRENLREATPSQNRANSQKIQKVTTSRFKGVFRRSDRNGWCAQIRLGGKGRYLGMFNSETDAATAYDLAARETFGEFARTNFA